MGEVTIWSFGDVRMSVNDYFLKGFTQIDVPFIHLLGNALNRLTTHRAKLLERILNIEEMMNAIKSCDPNISLRCDGFNLSFIRKCEYIIGEDVITFVTSFFITGS